MMLQDKCPKFRFGKEAIEDRNATIEAGRRITKDIDMAYVGQIGETNETPLVATEWLEKLRVAATGGNQSSAPTVPMEWYERAKASYENWQKGFDMVVSGTPVREWPILTPSQVANLHQMSTFTVEQIAGWTEAGMGMYGMGGRELRDKARLWLESGDAKAEQISALQVESKSKDEQIKKQAELISELSQRLTALEEGKTKSGKGRD